MPVEIPTRYTAPVIVPEWNYVVGKYMDLTKFISLLQRRALFFCRLDKLEDDFEGTTAESNRELRYQWFRRTNDPSAPMTEEEIDKAVKDYYAGERQFRSITCINCWNKFENESTALWKIYADFNKGILIRSSIERLKKSLLCAEQNIQLSEVRYIDYSKDVMPDGNTNFPVIHKHNAYSYEQEVRLIHLIPTEIGFVHDWSTEEVEEGIYIPVNLDDLIEEIVISPHSPVWFRKMIESLVETYRINKVVKKSTLSIK